MKRALIAILAVATSALSATAYAGYKSSSSIYIGSDYAAGSLGTARNSTDTNQQIGCRVITYTSGSSSMFCYAQNSARVSKSCSTTSPSFISLFSALQGDSWVYFKFNAYGTCTEFQVTNASEFEPKVR